MSGHRASNFRLSADTRPSTSCKHSRTISSLYQSHGNHVINPVKSLQVLKDDETLLALEERFYFGTNCSRVLLTTGSISAMELGSLICARTSSRVDASFCGNSQLSEALDNIWICSPASQTRSLPPLQCIL